MTAIFRDHNVLKAMVLTEFTRNITISAPGGFILIVMTYVGTLMAVTMLGMDN